MEQNQNNEETKVEEVTEEVTESTEEEINQYDEHKTNPIEEEKDIDPKEAEEYLPFPSTLYSKLVDALEKINSLTKEEFNNKYTERDAHVLKLNVDSTDYTNTEDMLAEPLNKEDGFINSVSYGSKELMIRPLPVNSAGKALNGDAAIARIASILGVGEVTQVPLWHSGFWVTLKPIKDVELINLDIMLTNNQIQLGRDTNTLIFSNYSVVFNRIITNFIVNHIQNTTLDLPAGEDIRKYIAVQDLYTLVNALLYSMYPKGHILTRTCSNTTVIDPETKKPKCDKVISGKIDFRKLLWVNRKGLSKEHMKIMSSRNPNSVTIDDVLEYQNTLSINKQRTKKFTTTSGSVLEVVFKSPTLAEYIDNGEMWVNNVIKSCESMFTDTTDDEERNMIIDNVTATMVLGVYNVYVDKIVLEDGSYIDDIDDALSVLSTDNKLLKEFLEEVKDYINSNNISIIGIPDYTCSGCKESQIKEDKKGPFKQMIPINVLESFFSLCVLRIMKAQENRIS